MLAINNNIKGFTMKIAIASDHGGWKLKSDIVEYYKKQGVSFDDLGTYSEDSCDYPDIATKMSQSILNKTHDIGILICGTGVGISIAANRNKGIRAAILYSDDVAHLAREHNNANIAVFGGRTMSFEDVIKRIEIFLHTDFSGGRHERRINKLDEE